MAPTDGVTPAQMTPAERLDVLVVGTAFGPTWADDVVRGLTEVGLATRASAAAEVTGTDVSATSVVLVADHGLGRLDQIHRATTVPDLPAFLPVLRLGARVHVGPRIGLGGVCARCYAQRCRQREAATTACLPPAEPGVFLLAVVAALVIERARLELRDGGPGPSGPRVSVCNETGGFSSHRVYSTHGCSRCRDLGTARTTLEYWPS